MPDDLPHRIALDRMTRLRAAGEAVALLGEYAVGPTWYAGAWWLVPAEAIARGAAESSGYVRADTAAAARFTELHTRLAESYELALAADTAAAARPGG